MTNRQKNGIGCFVLAALLAAVAIYNASTAQVGLNVGRVVGAFLPAVLLLALGLWLFQTPKSR